VTLSHPASKNSPHRLLTKLPLRWRLVILFVISVAGATAFAAVQFRRCAELARQNCNSDAGLGWRVSWLTNCRLDCSPNRDDSNPTTLAIQSPRRDLGAALEVLDLQHNLWLYRAIEEVDGFGPVSSNGLIVAGSDGVWIIDTPWNDHQTAVLFDWIEDHIGPLRGVVATHFHHDRLGGIAEAHRRQLETWGHAKTAQLAPSAGLEPPQRTFARSAELSTGSEPFEIFYPGPGHAPDNTVVWFPERNLLFGGCLVKSAGSKGAGYLGDARLAAWPASLKALEQRYPETQILVPGHGAPGSLELTTHTAALVATATQPLD